MKHKVSKKIRQQKRDFVNFVTEMRLKLNEGTQKTSVRIKDSESFIVPMCDNNAFIHLVIAQKHE